MKIRKILSVSTAIVFTWVNTVYGVPIQPIPAEVPSFLELRIPSELATVDEIYNATSKPDSPLILHIQNAHGSYEAQTQINKLLDFLNRTYGFKLLFVEGAVEKLQPDFLKIFKDSKNNEQLADQLTKMGELTGAELYLMSAPGDVEALGIEEKKLYLENYQAFRSIQEKKSEIEDFIAGLDARLERLISRYFSPNARGLLEEWKKFHTGRREFLPFIKNLTSEAKKYADIDLESLFAQVEWPQITRLLVLQSMEAELDRDEAKHEQAQVIQFLETAGVSKKIIQDIQSLDETGKGMRVKVKGGVPEDAMPRQLLERIAEEAGPKGFEFHKYPAFSLYAGYLILQSEMDHSSLFQEIEKLFDMVSDKVIVNQQEKNIFELFKDVDLLKKLMSLELTRKEWKALDYRKDWLRPDAVLGRTHKLEQEAQLNGVGDTFPDASSLFNTALHFYDLARQRESYFYYTIQQEIKKRNMDKAVLITGGFHSEGLLEAFREGQMSYGLLTPKLRAVPDSGDYIAAMMEGHPTMFDRANLEIVLKLQSALMRTEQGASADKEIRLIMDRFAALQASGDVQSILDFFNQTPWARDRQVELRFDLQSNSVQIYVQGRPFSNAQGRAYEIPVQQNGQATLFAHHVKAGLVTATVQRSELRTDSVQRTVSSVEGKQNLTAESLPLTAVPSEDNAIQQYLEETLSSLSRKMANGQINPFVKLEVSRQSPAIDDPRFVEVNRPLRVGVFGPTANPLTWGHLLAALTGMDQLNLDTVVFLVPGPITYKPITGETEIPVAVRHQMAKEGVRDFFPLLRYSDLGIDKSVTEETLHDLRDLNAERKVDFVFLAGGETTERTRRIMKTLSRFAEERKLSANTNHTLSWGMIDRGEFGKNLTPERLNQIKKEEGFDFAIQRIATPDFLDEVSSSAYRDSFDSKYIPHNVEFLYKDWAENQKAFSLRSELRTADGGEAQEIPFRFDGEGQIVKPIETIAINNEMQDHQLIQNILVYGYTEKSILPPKLGEEIIDIFPLVSSLRDKFPKANIYLASHFPDIFEAEQFQGTGQYQGKVIPIENKEIKAMYPLTAEGQEKRTQFLKDHYVDMVFDVTSTTRNFGGLDMKSFFNERLPYVIEITAPVAAATALGHHSGVAAKLSLPSVFNFWDRSGQRYPMARDLIPPDRVWSLSFKSYQALGLDANPDDLETVKLSVKESVAALTLLKDWYYEDHPDGYFDPSRKVFVVNVYAVTQQGILTEDEWAHLIVTLLNAIDNAYFIFTAGGPMDKDEGYLQRILNKVKKSPELIKKAQNGSTVVLNRQALYPKINDILGITSGVVTPDTGFSHLVSLYGIPTVVVTRAEVLQWMIPRNGIPAINQWQNFKNPNFEKLITDYVSQVNQAAERPEARTAKAAIASSRERSKLDEELFGNRLSFPSAANDLQNYLGQYLRFFELSNTQVPEIVFVDSAKQLGIDAPRFQAKLYTKPAPQVVSESGQQVTINAFVTYLLVDKSVLRGEPGKEVVADEIKGFEILHEVMGHWLARFTFQEYFGAQTVALAQETGEDDGPFINRLKAEEEIVAWLMTLLSIYRTQIDAASKVRFPLNPSVIEKIKRMDIDLSQSDVPVAVYISKIVDYLLSKDDDISLFRYKAALRDHREMIEQEVNQKYEETIADFFAASRSEVRSDSVERTADSGQGPSDKQSAISEQQGSASEELTAENLPLNAVAGRSDIRDRLFGSLEFREEDKEIISLLIPAPLFENLDRQGISPDRIGWGVTHFPDPTDKGKLVYREAKDSGYGIFVAQHPYSKILQVMFVKPGIGRENSEQLRQDALAYVPLRDLGDDILRIETFGRVASLKGGEVDPEYVRDRFAYWLKNNLIPFAQRLGFKQIALTPKELSINYLKDLGFIFKRPMMVLDLSNLDQTRLPARQGEASLPLNPEGARSELRISEEDLNDLIGYSGKLAEALESHWEGYDGLADLQQVQYLGEQYRDQQLSWDQFSRMIKLRNMEQYREELDQLTGQSGAFVELYEQVESLYVILNAITTPSPQSRSELRGGENQTFPALEMSTANYLQLTQDEKVRLREEFKSFFREKEKKLYYTTEKRFQDLAETADIIHTKYPDASYVALGASGEWIVKTLAYRYPANLTLHIPFSGGADRVFFNITPEQVRAYRKYLQEELNLTPEKILESESPLIVIDTVRSGKSLGVFLNLILINWAKELQLDSELLKTKLVAYVISPKSVSEDDYEHASGFLQSTPTDIVQGFRARGIRTEHLKVEESYFGTLIHAEGERTGFGDRMIARFPPEEWEKGKPQAVEVSQDARWMEFGLLDYLDRKGQLNQDYNTGEYAKILTSFRSELRMAEQDPLKMQFEPPYEADDIVTLSLSKNVLNAFVPQLPLVFEAMESEGIKIRAFGGVARGIAFATQFVYPLPISEIDIAVPTRNFFTTDGLDQMMAGSNKYEEGLNLLEGKFGQRLKHLELHETDEVSVSMLLKNSLEWSISKFWIEYDSVRKSYLLKGSKKATADLTKRILRFEGKEIQEPSRALKLLDQAKQYKRFGFNIDPDSLFALEQEIQKSGFSNVKRYPNIAEIRAQVLEEIRQLKESNNQTISEGERKGIVPPETSQLLQEIYTSPRPENQQRLRELHQELLASEDFSKRDQFIYEDEGDHRIAYFHAGVDYALKGLERSLLSNSFYMDMTQGADHGGGIFAPYALVTDEWIKNQKIRLPEDRGDVELSHGWMIQKLAFSLKNHIEHLHGKWIQSKEAQDAASIKQIESDLKLILSEWAKMKYQGWAQGLILHDKTFENAGITSEGLVRQIGPSFDSSWMQFFDGSTSTADLTNNVNMKWLSNLFDEETAVQVYENLHKEYFELLWPSGGENFAESKPVAYEKNKPIFTVAERSAFLGDFLTQVKKSEEKINGRSEVRAEFGKAGAAVKSVQTDEIITRLRDLPRETEINNNLVEYARVLAEIPANEYPAQIRRLLEALRDQAKGPDTELYRGIGEEIIYVILISLTQDVGLNENPREVLEILRTFQSISEENAKWFDPKKRPGEIPLHAAWGRARTKIFMKMNELGIKSDSARSEVRTISVQRTADSVQKFSDQRSAVSRKRSEVRASSQKEADIQEAMQAISVMNNIWEETNDVEFFSSGKRMIRTYRDFASGGNEKQIFDLEKQEDITERFKEDANIRDIFVVGGDKAGIYYYNGTVKVFSFNEDGESQEIRSFKKEGELKDVLVSADAKWIRYENDTRSRFEIFNMLTGENLKIPELAGARRSWFLENGRYIGVSYSLNNAVKYFDLETGRNLEDFFGSGIKFLRFFGSRAVISYRNDTLKIFDLAATEQPREIFSLAMKESMLTPYYIQSDRKIAFFSRAGSVKVIDLQPDSGPVEIFSTPADSKVGWAGGLSLSSDENRLAVYNGTVLQIFEMASGKNFSIEVGTDVGPYFPFSEDSKWIVFNHKKRIINLETRQDLKSLIGDDVDHIDFSKAGRFLLVHYMHARPRVFDLHRKIEVTWLFDKEIQDGYFSPDGKWFITSKRKGWDSESLLFDLQAFGNNPFLQQALERWNKDAYFGFKFLLSILKNTQLIKNTQDFDEYFPFFLEQIERLIAVTNDYNRERIFGLLRSQAVDQVFKKSGDIRVHLRFYIDLVQENKRLGLQILEGLLDGLEQGLISVELGPEERQRILQFIRETGNFNSSLYKVYQSEGGEAKLAEILAFGEDILDEKAGSAELDAFEQHMNAQGYNGEEVLLGVIQKVIPSSGASFVGKSDMGGLLKRYRAAGDRRNDVPEALRKLRRFGGGKIEKIERRLRKGEMVDPEEKVKTLYEKLKYPDSEKGESQKQEDIEADRRAFVSALRIFLANSANEEKASGALDAFLAYARHNDLLKEKIDRVQPDDYVGLDLLDQLFRDKDNLSVLLREALDSEFQAAGTAKIRNAAKFKSGLFALFGQLKADPEKMRAELARQIIPVDPVEIKSKILKEGLDPVLRKEIESILSTRQALPLSPSKIIERLFEIPLTILKNEKNKFEEIPSEHPIHLKSRVVKGPAYGMYALCGGTCIATDLPLWEKSEFYLLVHIDETQGSAVGFDHLFEKKVKDKKYMFVPGIEPSTEFMGEVKVEELLPKILADLQKAAEEEGADVLALPIDKNILSNRKDIYDFVITQGYEIETLPEKIQWNTLPKPYPFDKVYILWRRSQPAAAGVSAPTRSELRAESEEGLLADSVQASSDQRSVISDKQGSASEELTANRPPVARLPARQGEAGLPLNAGSQDVLLGFNLQELAKLSGEPARFIVSYLAGKILGPNAIAEEAQQMLTDMAKREAAALPEWFVNLQKELGDQAFASDIPGSLVIASASLPDESELQGLMTFLVANPNQQIRYVVIHENKGALTQQAKDLVQAAGKSASLLGPEIRNRFTLSVLDNKPAEIKKEIQKISQDLWAKAKKPAKGEDAKSVQNHFVLLGDGETLAKMDTDLIPAALIESDAFTDPAMRTARNFVAGAYSKYMSAEKLDEKTQQALEKSGNRYRIVTSALESWAGKLMASIQSALKTAASA